jgi:hypothetical protein
MEENEYRTAGWLAIAQAALFPAAFVIGIIESVVAGEFLGVRRPFIGPSDLLMIINTAIGVYTLLMFRRLLREQYDYHDVDLLIIISVWWSIFFQTIGLGLKSALMLFWPINSFLVTVAYIVLFASAFVTIGIIDILIGAKLLKVKEVFSQGIRNLAYIMIASGICEVTVLLAPLAIAMVPVWSVVLALVFLRNRQEVEFV